MKKNNSPDGKPSKPNQKISNSPKNPKQKSEKTQSRVNSTEKKQAGEVLLSLPGGFKYQLPGKRQRMILGSLVIGLNLLLVLAVVVYFYSPGFQSFVYNFGR